jgi:hypothetical protein
MNGHQMTRVVLHAPALDDAHVRHDAGTEFTIGEHISAERAGELIDQHLAADPDAPAADVPEVPEVPASPAAKPAKR